MSTTELYVLSKHIHVTTVVVSITLFVLRGAWMLADSAWLRARWARIVPHVNDTLLLASAIVLVWVTHQYPGPQHWLTAKVVGLVVYIGLGMVALRRGRTKRVRGAAFLAAVAVYGYIVSVALTRSVAPWGAL